ncbi:unnamed protein product [Bathycoccus prasinos]
MGEQEFRKTTKTIRASKKTWKKKRRLRTTRTSSSPRRGHKEEDKEEGKKRSRGEQKINLSLQRDHTEAEKNGETFADVRPELGKTPAALEEEKKIKEYAEDP